MKTTMDIKLITQLKQDTNLTLVECKQILEKSNWDYDIAIASAKNFIQEKSKQYDEKEALESIIAFNIENNNIYYIKYLFQTDLIYKSSLFINTVNSLLTILKNNNGIIDLNNQEVSDICNHLSGTAQEKCELNKFGIFKSEYHLAYYLHNGVTNNIGKILVALDLKLDDNKKSENIIRQLTHHFAAYPVNSIEEGYNANWLYDSTKTVKDILNENNIIINNMLFIA